MTETGSPGAAPGPPPNPALAAIGWYVYAPLLRAASRARQSLAEIPGRGALGTLRQAAQRARQLREGAPERPDTAVSRVRDRAAASAGDAAAVRQWVLAERARALAESRYPQAAAYGRAAAMSMSLHTVEAAAGHAALRAVEAGADATTALAAARAAWRHHVDGLA